MKRSAGKRALESYPVFPYIAWGLAVGFALFVYFITTELTTVTAELGHQGDRLGQLEARIEASTTPADDVVTQ